MLAQVFQDVDRLTQNSPLNSSRRAADTSQSKYQTVASAPPMSDDDDPESTDVLYGDMSDYFSGHKIPLFVCPPFARSRFIYGPKCAIIWIGPMCLAALGFFVQNVQLHIGTYYYVHKMVQHDLQMVPQNSSLLYSPDYIPLSIGSTPQNVSFGSLQDPVAANLGQYEKMSIAFLDYLAAGFPFLFMVLVVAMDQPYTMTRVMVCFCILAVGKGMFGWITVEPDSSGWQVCRERLATGKYTVDWYAQKHTMSELLTISPTSRLCADMMWSGHTYFVTIFAFGLHECTRIALRASSAWTRICVESLVAVAAVAQQSSEIYFVLKSRFHYTADVVMAVFVTYLLYTNSTIAVGTTWWLTPDVERMKEDFLRAQKQYKRTFRSPAWMVTMMSRGMISLGCCCCSWSQQYIYGRDDIHNIMRAVQEATLDLPESTKFREHPESQLKMTHDIIEDVTEFGRMLHTRSMLDHEDGGYDDGDEDEEESTNTGSPRIMRKLGSGSSLGVGSREPVWGPPA